MFMKDNPETMKEIVTKVKGFMGLDEDEKAKS